MRLLLAATSLMLVACGSPTTPITTEAGSAPPQTGPLSTLAFAPTQSVATRSPSRAACGESDPVFSEDDAFSVQASGAPGAVGSVSVVVQGWPGVGTRIPLTVLTGTSNGQAVTESKPSVSLIAFGSRTGTDEPLRLEPILVRADVTFLAFPSRDGETLSARVKLDFADGATLEATLSAPIVSFKGACGGG